MYDFYENFLPKENFEDIKRLLLSESFQWTYNGKSIEEDSTRFFMHDISYDGNENSPYCALLNYPIYFWMQHHTPNGKLVRSHVNFQLPGLQGTPHVDSREPGVTTVLFYITDSDGPTNLYDCYAGQSASAEDVITPVAQIPHIGNSLGLFESHRYHVGIAPSRGERINIAYMVK